MAATTGLSKPSRSICGVSSVSLDINRKALEHPDCVVNESQGSPRLLVELRVGFNVNHSVCFAEADLHYIPFVEGGQKTPFTQYGELHSKCRRLSTRLFARFLKQLSISFNEPNTRPSLRTECRLKLSLLCSCRSGCANNSRCLKEVIYSRRPFDGALLLH